MFVLCMRMNVGSETVFGCVFTSLHFPIASCFWGRLAVLELQAKQATQNILITVRVCTSLQRIKHDKCRAALIHG